MSGNAARGPTHGRVVGRPAVTERQDGGWRTRAVTLGWAVGLIFGGMALVGFDPADGPWASASPANAPVSNPCGPAGAWLAAIVMQTIGWGWPIAYASAIVLVARRCRGDLPPGLLDLLGVACLTLTCATLSQLGGGELLAWRSPAVGPGGYLGALTGLALTETLGGRGSGLILIVTAAVGIMLTRSWLVIEPLDGISAWIVRRSWWRRFRRAQSSSGTALAARSGSIPWRDQPLLPYEPLEESLSPEPASVAAHEWAERTPAVPSLQPGQGRANRCDPTVRAWTTAETPPAKRASSAETPSLATPRLSSDPGGADAGALVRIGYPAHALAIGAVEPSRSLADYEPPSLELLDPPPIMRHQEDEARVRERAALLEQTLADFGLNVRVVQIDTGPVITQFEIELEAGLRVSRIVSLADDLAVALAVPSVRIVAPIPGKNTVGIEVPNERRTFVKMVEIVEQTRNEVTRKRIPLFLGKDVKGRPLVTDLTEMPHLLIAGRTGSGKSVCLNALIVSMLLTRRPDELKLILIDPKKVELMPYRRVPHLMHPVVTDMDKVEPLLASLVNLMEERYTWLSRAGVRDIQTYNSLGPEEILARIRPEDPEEAKRVPTRMPYVVIVTDEMADLIMTAAKETETHIVRLAQKARAVGIHLILATQRPVVEVITGLIKANIPGRIAFQVRDRSNSRIVLDTMGAERLLDRGDLLFMYPGTASLIRAQGVFVTDHEVHRVCRYLERYPVEYCKELTRPAGGPLSGKDRAAALKERDELYEAAIEIVIREGRGSCSLLQRALGIGYGRASRLIDFMAEDGVVGEYKAGGPREVLVSLEDWEAMKAAEASSSGLD